MAIDVKKFGGILNSDDKELDIAPNQHIDARNVRLYGGREGLTLENVKGNYVIANSNLPAGTNECIGVFYDPVKRRIIWFNWNSNGNHGIYQLDIQTEVVTQIFRCGVNSATDILRFSLDYPVHSAAIVYRTEGDGDLLYWTDGNVAAGNRPRYLNLDTVSSLSPFTEDMINAAKNAPLKPCNMLNGGSGLSYLDDATVNVNNLKSKLFRFSYRWVYKNLEKSTFAPTSNVPIPSGSQNQNTLNDPTKDNNISVFVVGGGDDYQAIELLGQESLGNVWSDFFLIDTLDRDEYGILPEAEYQYNFYNNGSYPTVPVEDSDLYFDWLPNYANTLELLNGNVLIYGGLTDGYNRIPREDIDVVIGSGLSVGGLAYTYTSANSVMVFVTAAQTGATYQIQFDYSSGTGGDASPKNVNYTALLGDNVNDVALALIALLNGNNITCTSLGGGVFSIATSTGNGTITNFTTTSAGVVISSADDTSRWDWSSNQRFALIYFDERGKPIDVISYVSDSALDTTDFAVTTQDYSASSGNSGYPVITALINHLPPAEAQSFQWARAVLTPPPLYLVTNDYQTDTDFLYICIENLQYLKQKDTGFIPSYEFAAGDHVKVVAKATIGGGTTTYTDYDLQLDFEILGTVERTMTSPAATGTFLKVRKPSTLPSVAYSANMLIKIYTPLSRASNDQQIFFEWGQQYGFQTILGVRYHLGETFNQTASQPAVFQWLDGDMYYVVRNYYQNVNDTATVSTFITSPRFSEYFESTVNSNGRGWLLDENSREEYNSVLVRWGGKYQSGTNLNNLNRFRPADFDEVDRSKGDIRRFKARDRILRVFQDRGCGQYGIYARFIQNNEGVNDLVTTNEIITTNNIQYYAGTYGLSGYPTNLVSTQTADYFQDIVTGRAIRLSGDGITDLGLLYKGQYFLSNLVTPYNKDITRSNGSKAKVMGFFDYFEGQYHTVLQAGINAGTSYDPYNFSFNELRNAFCSFYDYHPEWAIGAEDKVYTWKDGAIWRHNSDTYCNFYGVQYNASITLVFNPNVGQKKGWQSVAEVASGVWECPLIYTDVKTYGSQRQESTLVPSEFTILEGMPTAAFKRDQYSVGGKWNGQFLKGQFIAVKFQKTNALNLISLNEIVLRYTDSPLNIQ